MLRLAMHFASGNSLVSGLAMLLIAYLLAATRSEPGRSTIIAIRLLTFLGAAFVILSTIPLNAAAWLALGLSASPLLVRLIKPVETARPSWSIQLSAAIFTLVGIAVVGSEYKPSVKLPASATRRPIVVIGDSLSAAETDPQIIAWPSLIAAEGWNVSNHARMGATAASALKQAAISRPTHAIVLVMIGGNDLLGPTTVPQFESSLEELVRAVSGDDVEVVLFELLLPPFKFEWGAVQRRIAHKYRCRLMTRRVIARVFGGQGNTVDGIHLSQKGHEQMARLVLEELLPNE